MFLITSQRFSRPLGILILSTCYDDCSWHCARIMLLAAGIVRTWTCYDDCSWHCTYKLPYRSLDNPVLCSGLRSPWCQKPLIRQSPEKSGFWGVCLLKRAPNGPNRGFLTFRLFVRDLMKIFLGPTHTHLDLPKLIFTNSDVSVPVVQTTTPVK